MARLALEDPARHRIWVWGRGSAKTTTAQFATIEAALAIPDCAVIVMLNTAIRARAVCWPDYVRWNREMELGGRVVGAPELCIHFKNGSRLYVTGADRMDLFDRKRGIKRIALVVLVEGQDWDPEVLKYAVTKVFAPRLGDLEATHGVKGRIIIEGTGNRRSGFYYRAATGEKEEGKEDAEDLGFGRAIKLTQWDNPHIADPDGEFREACRLAGVKCWKLDAPVFSNLGARPRWYDTDDEMTRREWFAEFNDGATEHNIMPEFVAQLQALIPGGRIVVGVDIGAVHKTACTAYWLHRNHPGIILFKSREKATPGTTAQLAFIDEFVAEMEGLSTQEVLVALDPAGGKALIPELAKLRGENRFMPAEKTDKGVNLELMSDDLRTGFLTVMPGNDTLVKHLRDLERDPKKALDGKTEVLGHTPDDVDSSLYGWRLARKLYSYEAPVVKEESDFDRFVAQEQAEREALAEMGFE